MIEERFGDFSLRWIEDTPVLALDGEIDISNVEDFRRALEAIPEADLVVVDMSSVEFIDSTALATLVRFRHDSATKKSVVALVIASPLVQRIFEITNFDQEFTIVKRLEDVPGLFPKA